jgi:hypothetical protein
VIGNPYPCNNFFYHAVEGSPDGHDKGGNIPRPRGHHARDRDRNTNAGRGEGSTTAAETTPLLQASQDNDSGRGGYYRRVIRIRGKDSPNVRYAVAESGATESRVNGVTEFTYTKGKPPSGRVLLPGVLPWADYVKRRQTWDKIRQCISLDARFYKGAEILLYPPEWLDRAEQIWEMIRDKMRRVKSIGLDPGEGLANTCMAAVDDYGVVEIVSKLTPDTSVIKGDLLAFMRRHGCAPSQVWIDRGGGGKQIADLMRSEGILRQHSSIWRVRRARPKAWTTPVRRAYRPA